MRGGGRTGKTYVDRTTETRSEGLKAYKRARQQAGAESGEASPEQPSNALDCQAPSAPAHEEPTTYRTDMPAEFGGAL